MVTFFKESLGTLISLIRPLLGIAGTCKYTVTCSAYAGYALKKYPLAEAIWRIIKRIVSCNFFITF